VTAPSNSRIAQSVVGWLAFGVCVSVALLVWSAYHAIRERQQEAAALANHRAKEAVDLLASALSRDMRGVQTLVLPSLASEPYVLERPDELRDRIATAFARYPYPDAFFLWRRVRPNSVVFLARTDRPLPWIHSQEDEVSVPVRFGNAADVGERLIDRIIEDAADGRRFSLFDLRVANFNYQTVSYLVYEDGFREHLSTVFGFVVNLNWVNANYFGSLTQEVTGLFGSNVRLTAKGPDAGPAETAAVALKGPAAQRTFPVMFFDPTLVAVHTPNDLSRSFGHATAVLTNLEPLGFGISGPFVLSVAGVAGAVLAWGLVLSARAVRARANLADLRAEFVSTVTHELKTPIAAIRVLGETLASGRLEAGSTSQEYAQSVVQEAKRLTRLIDNLLAYAKVTDVSEVYLFQFVQISALIDDCAREFQTQLTSGGFTFDVDIDSELDVVLADRTALMLAITNVIDNAIRYSAQRRSVRITARRQEQNAVIEVVDSGVGIPETELPQVTKKFFRGRDSGSGGSGLGLAICDRVISDHGGHLSIASGVGKGTTVTITLPVRGGPHEAAHSSGRG
jgi:two-component system phosphate regulon sensor histidine kinase PhoR